MPVSERLTRDSEEVPSAGGDDSAISVRVYFNSSPAQVRRAINGYLGRYYPQAMPYIKWDASGASMSAAGMGASCSIVLSGSGPTVVDVNGDIGFPASLFVSDKVARQGLGDAIRDIKKKTS